jgi:hypothetical protein
MPQHYFIRAQLSDLAAAAELVRVFACEKKEEVRAIYIAPADAGRACEVLVELRTSAEEVNRILKLLSGVQGFMTASVESLSAKLMWEGLRW